MDGSTASDSMRQFKPFKKDYQVIQRTEMAFDLPVNIPGHPKVTNLGYSSCASAGQKAIPCSYISLKKKNISNSKLLSS